MSIMTERRGWQAWRERIVASVAPLRPGWERARGTARAMLRPRSMSLQMALVAVTIALCAIVATALIAAIAVSHSFSTYTRAQLLRAAQAESFRIGDMMNEHGYPLNIAVTNDLAFKFADNNTKSGEAAGQIWVMDGNGNPLWPLARFNNVWNTPDPNVVLPALRNAITNGQSSQGDLPDPNQGWFDFTVRSYAVVPIVLDPTTLGSPIVGAVAISSDESVAGAGGPNFIGTVDKAILVSGLLVGIVVAIIGALLAQRVAKPITLLTGAASKLSTGDLSTRVALDEVAIPAEIAQLGTTFNLMAAKLEHDVEELVRQEQLQRELVANVAHELATPLTAISGYSEALADDPSLPAAQRDAFAHIIHRETVRLSKLVYQLRQVARLESGAEKMEMQPVALRPLISDTLDVLQAESEKQVVTLRNLIPDTLPLALVDTDRLTQVAINLLDNALRHTPMGGTVTVEARQEGDHIWVSITDSGTGIAQVDLPRVFDRFYRADTARNSATGGTGLGLAIVKGIVEAHGGQVRADNSPAGGARMSFSLRVAHVPTVAMIS